MTTSDQSGQDPRLEQIDQLLDEASRLDEGPTRREAARCYEAAAELLLEVGDRITAAQALAAAGDILLGSHAMAEAERLLVRSQSLAEQLGAHRLAARCLLGLGTARLATRDLEGALEKYEASRERMVALGDRRGEANALAAVSEVQARAGAIEEALTCHERALSLFDELGDRRGRAHALKAIGSMWSSLAEFERAREALDLALPLFVELWDRVGEANTYQGLGGLALAMGEPGDAAGHLEEALACHAVAADLRGMAGDLGLLGRAAQAAGQRERAVLRLEVSRRLHHHLDAHQGEIQNLSEQGELLMTLHGQTAAALACFRLAAERAEAIGAESDGLRDKVRQILSKIAETHPEVRDRLAAALDEDAAALLHKGVDDLLDDPAQAVAFHEDQLFVAETREQVEGFLAALTGQGEALLALDRPLGAVAAAMIADEAAALLDGEALALASMIERLGPGRVEALREEVGAAPEERRAEAVAAVRAALS